MSCDGEKRERTGNRKVHNTHSYPCRDEIDFVQNIDELLVRLFLPEELDNGLASCSEGISSVEDVYHDVG